jgi:hypothetical protein
VEQYAPPKTVQKEPEPRQRSWSFVLSVVSMFELVAGVALGGGSAAALVLEPMNAVEYGIGLVLILTAVVGLLIPGALLGSNHRWRNRLQALPALVLLGFIAVAFLRR